MTPNLPETHEHPDRGLDERRNQPSKSTLSADDLLSPAWDEDPNSSGLYASPPCFMHELDSDYLELQPSYSAGPVVHADALESSRADLENNADGVAKPAKPGAT